jgi:hypothetical protein
MPQQFFLMLVVSCDLLVFPTVGYAHEIGEEEKRLGKKKSSRSHPLD